MRFFILLCIFLPLSVTCQTLAAMTVRSGVVYKYYRYTNQASIHVLTLDLTKVKLVAGRAQDVGPGLQTVEDIAKHFSAIAGINGGFFRLKDTSSTNLVPAGVLKIDNNWHGIAYKSRGAIGWDPTSNIVLFDIVQTNSHVEINKTRQPINAMNTVLGINRTSLFSDCYGDINTNKSLGLLIVDQKISKISRDGILDIPQGAYVYYANGKVQHALNFKIGDSAKVQINVQPQLNPENAQLWQDLPFIMGGGPLLVSNGEQIKDFSREKLFNDFINGHYARTAVGVLANKQVVLAVTEQSFAPEAVGLTIAELAEFMHFLGCVAAVNLDGGGSSAMYTTSHNLPSGRPVADALLVLER